MDCFGCPIIDICDIANSIKKASLYANVVIESCRIKNQLSKADEIVKKYEQKTESVPTDPTPQPIAMPIVPTKTYRDFKEESNKLREQKQKGDGPTTAPVITVEEEPVVATQITLTTCPSCNGRTSMDDITTCSKCGKIVCSNCSTQNGGLMEDTPKIYCNECWDKQ